MSRLEVTPRHTSARPRERHIPEINFFGGEGWVARLAPNKFGRSGACKNMLTEERSSDASKQHSDRRRGYGSCSNKANADIRLGCGPGTKLLREDARVVEIVKR